MSSIIAGLPISSGIKSLTSIFILVVDPCQPAFIVPVVDKSPVASNSNTALLGASPTKVGAITNVPFALCNARE